MGGVRHHDDEVSWHGPRTGRPNGVARVRSAATQKTDTSGIKGITTAVTAEYFLDDPVKNPVLDVGTPNDRLVRHGVYARLMFLLADGAPASSQIALPALPLG